MKCMSTLAVLAMVLGAGVAVAADWPCWNGPDQNNISKEAFSTTWPAEGPKSLWKAEVGIGFSSFAVAGGKAYTLGNLEKKKDVLYCFDAETGKEAWNYGYDEPLTAKYYEGGPSATPTVHEAKVYWISKSGKIFCLKADTGAVIWQSKAPCDPPTWGFAGSALIHGSMVIFNVGGWGLALNKDDGKPVWESDKSASGYATPVPFVKDGKPLLAIFGSKACYGVEAATGKKVWSFEWVTNYDVNASDPIVVGDQVFVSSGYDRGCGLFRIEGDKGVNVWENKAMRSQISGPIMIGDFVYGIDENQLRCVEFKTGKETWTDKSIGKGSLTASDGKLIVLSEKGKLLVAPVDPQAFKPIVEAQVQSGKCWTRPVLANGRIFLRNTAGSVICLDVKK
jgi:outer membrane protein assembly factor BamB